MRHTGIWSALILASLAVTNPAFSTEIDHVKPLAQKAGFIVHPNLYRKPAPDFEYTKADGTRLSLAKDLTGRPVIVYLFVPG
jgi:cytochrome oxidase Cu insertion factor (SCO1/SenC/PrrC family)